MKPPFNLSKTIIIIAVLFCFTDADAQEHNNWMLGYGAVLNFDTSPASVTYNDTGTDFRPRHAAMLSDDNGQILIYGYHAAPDDNGQSFFLIKDKHNRTIISEPCTDLRNVIGCRLPQGGYYIAAVMRLYIKSALHVYKFSVNGEFEKEYLYDTGDYTFLIDFVHADGDIVLVAYKAGMMETYKLTAAGCFPWTTTDITLGRFSSVEPAFF